MNWAVAKLNNSNMFHIGHLIRHFVLSWNSLLFCLQTSTNQCTFIPKDKGALIPVFTIQVTSAKYWQWMLWSKARRNGYCVWSSELIQRFLYLKSLNAVWTEITLSICPAPPVWTQSEAVCGPLSGFRNSGSAVASLKIYILDLQGWKSQISTKSLISHQRIIAETWYTQNS